MVPRPTLPTVLVGLGIALLVVSAVPVGGSTDVDYVHRVDPAANGTLAYGLEYAESDVLAYRNLSDRGRTAFDRARADSPYVVENESATAPEFDYTSDAVAVGDGLYPVRYRGEMYSLRTERRSAGFNAAAWLLSLLADAFRILGGVLLVAGVFLLGWRRSRAG
ncbi:MAG: hypothetical protein ABEI80_03750 [Haloplanus sp.]